jgi:hypothetical protein
VLRGTEHVLIARLAGAEVARKLADFTGFAGTLRSRLKLKLRAVAIVSEDLPEPHGVGLYRDEGNEVARAYDSEEMIFLVRPDGYIGGRGGAAD